jgi:hypothetical protein
LVLEVNQSILIHLVRSESVSSLNDTEGINPYVSNAQASRYPDCVLKVLRQPPKVNPFLQVRFIFSGQLIGDTASPAMAEGYVSEWLPYTGTGLSRVDEACPGGVPVSDFDQSSRSEVWVDWRKEIPTGRVVILALI